jgi:hypothetical protein
MLDQRTCANITVTAAPVAAIISSTVVTGRVVITIGSVIGVPAVISVVIFIGRPGAQETPYRWVLLSWLVIVIFRGRVVPIPRLVVIIVLIFQFPVEKELEILTIGQELIILWISPEVLLLCIPVQRSTGLMSSLGVELRGHLSTTLRCSVRTEGVGGWGGHGERKEGWCSCYRFEEGDGCTMHRCEVK